MSKNFSNIWASFVNKNLFQRLFKIVPSGHTVDSPDALNLTGHFLIAFGTFYIKNRKTDGFGLLVITTKVGSAIIVIKVIYGCGLSSSSVLIFLMKTFIRRPVFESGTVVIRQNVIV